VYGDPRPCDRVLAINLVRVVVRGNMIRVPSFFTFFFCARSGFFIPPPSPLNPPRLAPSSNLPLTQKKKKKPQCGFIRAASPKGFPRHVHDVSLPYPDWLRAVADLVLDAEGRQHTEVLLYR
jgi:hypothetical protein